MVLSNLDRSTPNHGPSLSRLGGSESPSPLARASDDRPRLVTVTARARRRPGADRSSFQCLPGLLEAVSRPEPESESGGGWCTHGHRRGRCGGCSAGIGTPGRRGHGVTGLLDER